MKNKDYELYEFDDISFDIDIDETGEEALVKTRAKKRYEKNMKTHMIKAKHLNDVAPIPAPGEHYLIITEKQFNAFALILALLENNIIDEMYLAIYRINEPTVDAIIEFMDAGKIKKGTFVISSFFNQTKKPEQWAIKLREYCEKKENLTHIYTHNHAKVLAAKSGENYYVFEGSGNMSDNARIEQYRYENSRESYEFHKAWMLSITE